MSLSNHSGVMRPTSRPQSALRHPLNHVLGTEANVRVLRVILLSEIPIGVSELARRAELQASGVARVCERLEDIGVIEAVGRGARNRQYRQSARFPLGALLVDLFRRESQRAIEVMQELQNAVHGGAEGVRGAWIEGPVASGTDRPGDPIIVTLLAEPAAVDALRVEMWRRLLPIQTRYDVVLELRVVTIADLETATKERLAELEDVRPLLGPPPRDLIEAARTTRRSTTPRHTKRHQHVDARAKEIARVIADRIARDPSIVDDAKRYIEKRMLSASPGEQLELREWQHILSAMSSPRLRRFLVSDDARATRLRQSSPFIGVLSDQERRRLFDAAKRR